jgi:hypothetical protein
MADASSSTPAPRLEKQPRGPFSPYFGCTIFIVIIVGAVLLLTLGYYSLSSQDAALAAFTVDAPVQLNAKVLSAAEQPALEQKLAAFRAAVVEKKSAELSLTVAELNTLIQSAPDSDYGGFKEMVAFTSTLPEKKQLLAAVCLPLNKMRFWEGKRYAIGTVTMQPMIAEKVGLDLQLQSLTVPDKVVNQDFVDRLMLWHWLTPYTKMEGIGAVLAAVSAVEVTSEGVKLTATPGAAVAAP